MKIDRHRIHDVKGSQFKNAWNLYHSSFPIEERREMNSQKMVMPKKEYHFDLIYTGEVFIGIFLWWKFEKLRYIEHFAIEIEHRSHGFGSQILNHFIAESNSPIILEVEKPISLVQQKRIQFYKHLGFHLNNHDYQQPPYSKYQPPLPLLLMSWPNTLALQNYDYFIQECHPIIFPT
ncbi:MULTISPECIES: GNAT family N-acetyltransferase [unclassified Lentimicrobium]|uniref:GNAT family N-acetyltransferase n=1 Tax=unclassified Lentimicrobium TaxID=2677434 RepID=UPI001552F5F6|nr:MULTISPECIES: GNAT family N-acetyltransferase [unclassified Lentimicrobium]NPD47090.1 GNAT family N-acetyltransferase [Lentimicrobium sp. S6]NPD85738.1 GNAT family N-acetyltransferase [Lentimicrobium sp. L6]